MSTGGIIITPTMEVDAITPEIVIEEGQLQLGYFPNCATLALLKTFIEVRITDSDDFVQEQVGAVNYASSDVKTQRQLKKTILYLTLSRLWQIIKNVMDGYDAESLPPEFVQPEQAAANRDYYAEEANRILMRYDATPGATAYVGSFSSDGVADDATSILGLIY
jgi:hypothetical protein